LRFNSALQFWAAGYLQRRYMLMKKHGSIRNTVVNILTAKFGDFSKGIYFDTENTYKRSSPKKMSKYELKTSIGWTAASNSKPIIFVNCIGMTMTEFLNEYENNNLIYLKGTKENVIEYSIYKNEPIIKTYGYTEKIDQNSKLISLHIVDLFDTVSIPITDSTPKWIYKDDKYKKFDCKIYQYWKSLSVDDVAKENWDRVWRTFKFDRYLSDFDVEYFI
jgi:hypothetical protein